MTYYMSTNNGTEKTYRTLADAQEGAERVFGELLWERYDENDGRRWLGFEEGAGLDAVAEVEEGDLTPRYREALRDAAERHVDDVLSMGIIEPSGRDVEGWHVMDIASLLEDADLPGEEEWVDEAKDVLAELIDEVAQDRREQKAG